MKIFKKSWIFPSALFLMLPSLAEARSCQYGVDPASVMVHWIAFKTTEKLAVQGTLKEVAIQASQKPQSSLTKLMTSLRAKGMVDQQTKSDTGNPGRDMTLFQKYFSLIARKAEFSGMFTQVTGDDHSGKLNLELRFNSKKKSIPMDYALTDQGDLEIKGEFNMLDFGLTKALDSIHQACEELHKGKDGVSKTWPDVGLKIKAKVTQNCSS